MIHLFSGDVLLSEKCVENQFPLPGKFEVIFSKMLLQRSHFLSMFGRHDQTYHTCIELKM